MLPLGGRQIYHFFQHNKYMPLGPNVKKNIKELYEDNKKSGKEKGNNGKKRSLKQIIAISFGAARKSNDK